MPVRLNFTIKQRWLDDQLRVQHWYLEVPSWNILPYSAWLHSRGGHITSRQWSTLTWLMLKRGHWR